MHGFSPQSPLPPSLRQCELDQVRRVVEPHIAPSTSQPPVEAPLGRDDHSSAAAGGVNCGKWSQPVRARSDSWAGREVLRPEVIDNRCQKQHGPKPEQRRMMRPPPIEAVRRRMSFFHGHVLLASPNAICVKLGATQQDKFARRRLYSSWHFLNGSGGGSQDLPPRDGAASILI